MGVREAREGREGIWTRAKARSSAKHTVQECQQTPSHPVLYQREEREKKQGKEKHFKMLQIKNKRLASAGCENAQKGQSCR